MHCTFSEPHTFDFNFYITNFLMFQKVLYPPFIKHDVSMWTTSADSPNIVPVLLECVGLALHQVIPNFNSRFLSDNYIFGVMHSARLLFTHFIFRLPKESQNRSSVPKQRSTHIVSVSLILILLKLFQSSM